MKKDDLLKRVTINPNICYGKPTIRGLRYSVETIIELLNSGMSNDEILEDYEDLEREDIMASLLYAFPLGRECEITAKKSASTLRQAQSWARTVLHYPFTLSLVEGFIISHSGTMGTRGRDA